MAGRPPLRIGQHGKIIRIYLGGGVWLARCRFRDSDGVVRRLERRGPPDEHDQHGKLAEDALVEALIQCRAAGDSEVTLDTKIMDLVGQHIDRLVEDGRAVRTIDTYRYCAKLLSKIMSGVRVGEATPARLDAAIRSMRRAHGDVMAVQSKTILKGGLHLAVMANVIGSNPVRDVSPMRSKTRPKGATALTADELRTLLAKLRASEDCQRHDLVDPITLFIATGLRISELLGLQRSDFDEDAATLTITGKVIRAAGKGLLRIDETKTAAGRRTLPLPIFAATVLSARRSLPYLGEQSMVFPSTAGTWRDPDNFRARWIEVRDDLGVPGVTTHSFRKTVATRSVNSRASQARRAASQRSLEAGPSTAEIDLDHPVRHRVAPRTESTGPVVTTADSSSGSEPRFPAVCAVALAPCGAVSTSQCRRRCALLGDLRRRPALI